MQTAVYFCGIHRAFPKNCPHIIEQSSTVLHSTFYYNEVPKQPCIESVHFSQGIKGFKSLYHSTTEGENEL